MNFRKPQMTLEKTILLLVCVVVALSLMVTDLLISQEVANNTEKSIEDQAVNISRIVAHSPVVIEGLSGKRDEKEIQDYANEIAHLTNVKFIVVFDMNGIRKSHPDSSELGKPFVGGDEGPVLQGQEHISTAKGTLGVSLRAFTPVFTPEGKQVGAVAVGVLLDTVQETVSQSRSRTYLGMGFGLLVGIVGAIVLAKKIKKIMFGLEPAEIAKRLQERNAMLESTREGILAVDSTGKVTLANTEALRLFKQVEVTDVTGLKIEEHVPDILKDVLTTGEPKLDFEYNLRGVNLVANTVPIKVKDQIVGAISTFRDKTEMKQLVEELSGAKVYAEALRAQTHEFKNKIQVILGMIHMQYYDQLARYVSEIANRYQAEVGLTVRNIKEPVLAGFILGKLSYAREMGCELELAEECFIPQPADPEIVHDLVAIIGNLIDNALEAVAQGENKRVALNLVYEEGELLIEVTDHGPGIPEEIREQIFMKGYSTKANNRGFGLFLVKRRLEQRKGQMEVYTKEGQGTIFRVYLPFEAKEGKHD
ncbi:DcuS/MalK family sensor histidine kinase [Desulfitobacterium sp.]|uniref:DcuS/MalK family sensor histidine kinase n=1 Tax=Desulfitobacterium sp. TaxID=49981 RepID=UPI002B20CF14|nr:DcuS/MalK family sensor histidine kinase [Desulfitobacterium sp.]MEA4902216.1 DcuS/MalK family sensor histidine kinase [Desulfitobacterium sp.]